MTSYVTSVDGTRIAFDRLGDGEPVVLVGGMFNDRHTTRTLAEHLARRSTVINYDRRGRGLSGDMAPYAVEHEVEDLAALIFEAGGTASVYGHSSGAGLALNAAASGLPISRLVLHEPPYGADDDESRRQARKLAHGVRAAIEGERPADAIALFFRSAGMPAEIVDEMIDDPRMLAAAPTMPYDFEVMGGFSGGAIPEELVRTITIPTLVLAGSASPRFFRDAATRIAELLPNGMHVVLGGEDHGAPADVVAPVVADFLAPVTLEASA
jgi:pimeloyl-ACP methyl ester carboxylesterase